MYTIKSIPSQVSEADVLYLISNQSIDGSYVNEIKESVNFSDNEIAKWLNVNVKTFRNYKQPAAKIKPDIQEHTIMLLSLIKHGSEVFGNLDLFSEWLNTENFFLDYKKPSDFLNTISGIRFIDARLTGIEYGDNA